MTNWPAIVSDLLNVMPRAELARITDAGTSTLSDLAAGKSAEPRHALGVRLLKLHAKRARYANKNPS